MFVFAPGQVNPDFDHSPSSMMVPSDAAPYLPDCMGRARIQRVQIASMSTHLLDGWANTYPAYWRVLHVVSGSCLLMPIPSCSPDFADRVGALAQSRTSCCRAP